MMEGADKDAKTSEDVPHVLEGEGTHEYNKEESETHRSNYFDMTFSVAVVSFSMVLFSYFCFVI